MQGMTNGDIAAECDAKIVNHPLDWPSLGTLGGQYTVQLSSESFLIIHSPVKLVDLFDKVDFKQAAQNVNVSLIG